MVSRSSPTTRSSSALSLISSSRAQSSASAFSRLVRSRRRFPAPNDTKDRRGYPLGLGSAARMRGGPETTDGFGRPLGGGRASPRELVVGLAGLLERQGGRPASTSASTTNASLRAPSGTPTVRACLPTSIAGIAPCIGRYGRLRNRRTSSPCGSPRGRPGDERGRAGRRRSASGRVRGHDLGGGLLPRSAVPPQNRGAEGARAAVRVVGPVDRFADPEVTP